MPSTLLTPAVTWSLDSDPDIAWAHWTIGTQQVRTNLLLGADGRLGEVGSLRWGDPNGEPFAEYPFGAIATGKPGSTASPSRTRCVSAGSTAPTAGAKANSSDATSPTRGSCNGVSEPDRIVGASLRWPRLDRVSAAWLSLL
jgi:hypothetical protein